MSQKELDDLNLWDKGKYSFEIITSSDYKSQAGNEMIKLGINVFNEVGMCQHIFCYLTEKMPHLVRHAAECCGLIKDYEAGELNAISFENRVGELTLGVQKAKDGYPAKNTVIDFVVSEVGVTQQQRTKQPDFNRNDLDDEIPFEL